MSSLREAQKQLTRDMIVDRALELFTEKGYAATTIDEIAVAAGTTRATFYAHYPRVLT
ncbi:helix-turn-helix domain containing protein [Arthrobacter sp. OVS8]|nr:helix-turn-helix domain containing protein [Arthrobacter sp. OVS8]